MAKKSRISGKAAVAVVGLAILPIWAAAQAPGRGKSEVEVGGKKVSIEFGRPSTEGPGYKSMQGGVPDGYIWRMGSNQATKLVSEVNLQFGDKVVQAGSYSLWAKRAGEGWTVLVHPEADVWGMPVKKEGFIAELALKYEKIEEPVQYMTIELKAEGEELEFRLAWGDEQGKGKLKVAP